MTLFAYALAKRHGYDFPLASGHFVEAGPGQFTLEAGPAAEDPTGATAA